MFDVLHQLIDRVRWAKEEELVLAHQAVEDFRAHFEGTEPAPSTVDNQPTVLSVADAGSHPE